VALTEQLSRQLTEAGRKPYVIPVGGSNSLGMWGYMEAVEEMAGDIQALGITDIAMVRFTAARTYGSTVPVCYRGLCCHGALHRRPHIVLCQCAIVGCVAMVCWVQMMPMMLMPMPVRSAATRTCVHASALV
jgi:hypothetical protein